jgi:hypothetical protein
MRVPYSEDLASHTGPEPHGGCGNTMADAWVGGSAGGALSSEITSFGCRPCCLVGKAISTAALNASCGRTWRSLSTLACVDTSCAGIGRPVNPPVFKSWNGRIHLRQTSWCDGSRPLPLQAMNTKPGRKYRVGWGRSKSVRPPQNVSRESDNNIVPEKQANKRKCRPQRSLWRKGR